MNFFSTLGLIASIKTLNKIYKKILCSVDFTKLALKILRLISKTPPPTFSNRRYNFNASSAKPILWYTIIISFLGSKEDVWSGGEESLFRVLYRGVHQFLMLVGLKDNILNGLVKRHWIICKRFLTIHEIWNFKNFKCLFFKLCHYPRI